MAASSSSSSAASLLSSPPLTVAWPSMSSVQASGQWAALLEDSARLLQQWHQAQSYKQVSATDALSSSPEVEEDDSSSRDSGVDSSSGGGGGGGVADGGVAGAGHSGDADSDDVEAASSAELALDTELQTSSFVIGQPQQQQPSHSAAAAADSSTASSSSTAVTAPLPSLRIPSRLTNQWKREVSDVRESSFGCLYEKRLHILRSLFTSFARHEAQQQAREAQEVASASSIHSQALFKRPYSTAQVEQPSSSSWGAFGASLDRKPSVPQQQQTYTISRSGRTISTSNGNSSGDVLSDAELMVMPTPVWPQLPARDPSSSATWATELEALQQKLQTLEPLQLRREYVAQTELAAWFNAAESSLGSLSDDQAVGLALSDMVGVAVSSGWPSLILACVRLLLGLAQTRPTLRISSELLASPLEHMAEHQRSLDISAPFQTALQISINQVLPSQAPQPASSSSSNAGSAPNSINLFASSGRGGLNANQQSSAQGLATEGTYLYVHTRDGLEKIGSGFNGTVRGQRYAYRPDYRNAELVRLCVVGNNKIYALSNRMPWPRVEVLRADTLQSEGFLQLGLDPEFSSPAQAKGTINHMMTDGRLLYVLAAEEREEGVDEGAAAEYADQLLALLNELEDAKKSEVQVADLDTMKEELQGLLEALQSANEERIIAAKAESITSPRRKMAGAGAAAGGVKASETKSKLPSAFGSRNDGAAAAASESKESESKQADSSSAASVPSTPSKSSSSAAFTTPKKEPLMLKKIREASALSLQMLVSTRAANSAGAKTPVAVAAGAAAGAQPQFIYPSANSVAAKAMRLLGMGSAPAVVAADAPAAPPLDKEAARIAAAALASAEAAKKAAKKKFVKLSLWVYDPSAVTDCNDRTYVEDLFVTQDDCERRIAESEARLEAARDLSAAFAHAYSVRLCITALKRSHDDRNTACRWLLDSGEDHRQMRCIPLKKSLVIANIHPQLTAEYVMQGVSCYVTPSQLVMLVPAHSHPWTTDERSLVRVISLEDGLLFEEQRISLGRPNSQICYDTKNNLIWLGALQHSVSIMAYTNHGPSGAIVTIPSASDEEVAKNAPAAAADASAVVALTQDNVLSTLPPPSQLRAPTDVALFLLAHMDRNLKHRDISTVVEVPLLDHRRSQLQFLSNQLDSLRAEIEGITKAKGAADDAAALLGALPAMDMLESSSSDGFPASPQGSEVEALLASLLNNQRSALSALVERRNNPNKQQQAQQATPVKQEKKFPGGAIAAAAAAAASGNGGRATLPPEQAALRLEALNARVALVEAQMALTTASLTELESRASTTATPPFCPRAPTQPFCIEVADAMFSGLYQLMESVAKVNKKDGSVDSAYASYTTEVCLRMLRVHLEMLLKHTQHTPLASTPLITRSRELRGLLLEFALSNDTPAAPALVGSGSSSASVSVASALSVLISGIKIFYPTQIERVKLLTDLIAEFKNAPAPVEPLSLVSADSSSSKDAASAAALPNKKMELLQGIMCWFSAQSSLADILLVNQAPSKESALVVAATESASASSSTVATVATPASVDTGALIRSLIDYSLAHEFRTFKARTLEQHRIEGEKSTAAASGAAAAAGAVDGSADVFGLKPSSNVPYPPCLSLLLVLEMDLIRKSGLLCIPAIDPNSESLYGHHSAVNKKSSPFGKPPKKSRGGAPPPPAAAFAAAAASLASDDLPSGAPQLLASESSNNNGQAVWGGLSLQLGSGAGASASAAEEVPFEVAALADSASSASSSSSETPVLNPIYFERLMEYTSAVIERCEALVDTLAAEELAAGGSKRSRSCASYLAKNSIMVLLPALLTSLGSPAFAAQQQLQAMTLLPALQSLLTKVDALNSSVPNLRSEDAKFSRLLAAEHTKSYTFETPHPYPSGFRVIKQTLSIPGATHIRWTFDPRSSSMNGNDCLRFFSDAAMTKPIGNVMYGNDRDSNSTWSKNSSMLTPGDTVTLCFSAKGPAKQRGRDGGGAGSANVDPVLRFGFKCLAKGVFIHTVPWLLDLQHTVAGLMGRCIKFSIGSNTINQHEMAARPWFQYSLMTRGLEECMQLQPPQSSSVAASASATPQLTGSRTLVSRPSSNALSAASAKSPALAFLDRFIDGSDDTKMLFAELDKATVSFAGRVLLKKLPAPLQAQWARALRATMAACIKHSGLTMDVYSVFGEGNISGSAAGSSSAEHKSSDSLGNLSSRARALLLERLKLVSVSAKSLQNWMMEQVQAHNEWNAWFSPARMTANMVEKVSAAKLAAQQAAKMRELRAAVEAAQVAEALAGGVSADEVQAAAEWRSEPAVRSAEWGDAEADLLDGELSVSSDSHSEGEDFDEEEKSHSSRKPRRTRKAMPVKKKAVKSVEESKEREEKQQEEKEIASPASPFSVQPVLELTGDAAAATAAASEKSVTISAPEEPVERELVYAFNFGLDALKEEYDAGAAAKVKALCSIKRIRLRSDTTSSSSSSSTSTPAFDLDEALSKLLIALERERREKQLHGRLHPAHAFHTLDAAVIKNNSYAIVIEQVYAMARALVCFKTNEEHSTYTLSPPRSPVGSTAGAAAASGADSDDLPPPTTGVPMFGRALSELPSSSTNTQQMLSPRGTSTMLARTLSREVRGSGDAAGGAGGNNASSGVAEDRVEDLRSWVNNYSRWRSWQSAHQPLSGKAGSGTSGSSNSSEAAAWQAQHTSPIDAITRIIRANLDARALLRVALAHESRAQGRRAGLQALARALDSASFEVARVNLVGLLPAAFQLTTASASESGSSSGAATTTDGGAAASTGAAATTLVNIPDSAATIFIGMETASVASKASVQDAYESLLQVLLSLLKPSSAAKAPAVSAASASSPRSALFTDAYVSPPRRNCYASRLLALTDIFALPFSPLRIASTNASSTPATGSSSSTASASATLSLTASSLSSLVPSSRRHLFALLTDSLSVSGYLRRVEPWIAEEVARDRLTLQLLVEREVELDRSEAEIRQAQERLAKQVEEDKERRAQEKIRLEEEKKQKMAEAAKLREERAARKAAEAAAAAAAKAAGGAAPAAGAGAAGAAAASDEDDFMGAMNLFGSDSDSDSAPAASPAAAARSVSEDERARVVAEQTARAEAEYLAKIARQFGDGSDQNRGGQQQQQQGGGRGRKVERNDGSGNIVAAAPSGELEDEVNGHMTVVQNRHGQSRSVWVKGNPSSASSAAAKAARREQRQREREERERNGEQHHDDGQENDDDRDEENQEDDVPPEDEADGSNAQNSSGGTLISLPTISDLNAAFAAKEWSALRLTLVQLLQWSDARVRASLSNETEATRESVLLELRSLRTSVLRQLTRELIAALEVARTLSRHHHSWHLRAKLLELLEQLLQLFLLLAPVAFAAAIPASAGGLASAATVDAPAMIASQQQLAITLLFLVQEHQALTPRITLLALRLARRVLPALDSEALWRAFVSQASTSTSAESAAASPPVIGSSLSEWLVQRIGALLTAESLAEYQKRQAEESAKRLAKKEETQKKLEAAALAKRLAAAAAAGGESKEKEEKDDSVPVTMSAASSSFPAKTHTLTVHYQDTFTTDQWATLLAQPAYIELAYGVRGVLPPRQEDVQARAASEFERRQKCRKGPNKVQCLTKSGSLEQNDLRISSRSGFSTFVANVGVTGGKWYYQVVLATRGLLQIGWATAAHNPSSADGQGTGDDKQSWAYDGFRMKKWHAAPDPYTTQRWNSGDVIGCAIDLDVAGGEMSFYINGENQGVAFAGFYNSELGPIYPAASISASECATWHFDVSKMVKRGSMRTKVPDGYATLEGDRITFGDPVPAKRAAEIARALEFAGHFHLLEADYSYCETLARTLAAEHGCTLTVAPIEAIDSLVLVDPTTPNEEIEAQTGSAAYPKQVQKGAVATAFASELVAFCRFMLKSDQPAWAAQMQSTLRQALHASPGLLQSESSFSTERVETNTLLGALCVLGGFTESVRVGGLVRVAAGGDAAGSAATAAVRGLVVQANEHANYIRAVYLNDLVASQNGTGSAQEAASAETLSHRLLLSHVVAVPELQVDLQMFAMDEQTFEALQKRIETPLPPAPVVATPAAAAAALVPAPAAAASSSSASAVAPVSAVTPAAAAVAAPRSLYRWLLGELKWRSVAVLESLLTTAPPPASLAPRLPTRSVSGASASSSSSSEDMLLKIGVLLVSHSRGCRLELQLDSVCAMSERLSHKAWDMRNVVDAQLAPVPFQRRRAIQQPPANAPHANSFDTVYSSSSYREEKVAAPVADDALLRYWEKYLIPGIQNYVKGSFKPYEMENFFAQLRQPLRQNNQASAIEIALTLTGGHVPDGIAWPDDSRDFLTLTLDDVRIGSCYQVLPSAANSDLWVEAMDPTVMMVGKAKAVHVGEELVLLQFYSPQSALLNEWWLPVENLKLVTAARNVQLSHLRDYESVMIQLEESQSHLSSLIARRAIFTLVARGGESSQNFLQHQLDRAGGLEPMLEWLFLSVSESLELSDLNRLGQAIGNQRESLSAFQANLISFLNQQRATGGLSSTLLCSIILKFFKRFIASSAVFTKSHSITSSFTLQPPVASSGAVAGGAPPRSNESADLWQHLKVEGASALVILFSNDTRLSKGSMLSLYPDSSASELIKSFAGREESPVLTPLVASGCECYIHCTPPQDIPARSSIKVLPISSFLPLAFWLVDLLLNSNTSMSGSSGSGESVAASPSSSSSSVAASSSSSSSLGSWSSGYEDGGLVGLCYTLCEMILENYALSEIAPSPLKEALLKLVSSLIATITTCKHAEIAAAASASASSSAPPSTAVATMARPQLQRQISEAKNASQARTLSILRQLHSEMVALYQSESANLVFTSYLQQLVDLLAASDELRPVSERLCSKFEFQTALSPEEAKAKAAEEAAAAAAAAAAQSAPAMWVCGVCTFENAEGAPGCDMCGSPKPKATKKAAAGGGGGGDSSAPAQSSDHMLHDMMALIGAMRLLNGEVAPEESPACMAMLESCWREARRDTVDKRMIVIENIPGGDRALVAAALAKALRALDGTIRLDPAQIFIGTDPSKPAIKEPVNKEAEAAAAALAAGASTGTGNVRDFLRRKQGGGGGAAAAQAAAAAAASAIPKSGSFVFKALGDENGVLYHLGALAKLEKHESKWVNPATTNVVVATASSTDSSSDALSTICGREAKRFATKNQPKQWVCIEFVGYSLSLRKYTIRHAETPKTEALRGWKLEGSRDGRKWTLLDERKNDQNLTSKGVIYSYEVRQTPATKELMTFFRLSSTQPNSGNTHTLALGNLELYGTLKKEAEKAEPIPTPHYAVVQLNSAVMEQVGGGAAAPLVGGKPAVPSHQALLSAIKQLSMPLYIRAPPPVDKAKEAEKAAAIAAAEAADKLEAAEKASAAAPAAAAGDADVPAAAAASPAAAAAEEKSAPGFGKAKEKEKDKPAQQQQGGKQAANANSQKKGDKNAPNNNNNAKSNKQAPKKDARSMAEIEAERLARQKASDERRVKIEADRAARAQREREEEAAREEAAKHVQLNCIKWAELVPSDASGSAVVAARARNPIINAFLRSKFVQGIEAEMRGVNPAQPNKPPAVKNWGNYRPTAEFREAVQEIVRRHAGPLSHTPSLRGEPALDSHALSEVLAYGKLESQPALEKEIQLMRKQAALPTGLEVDMLVQILCKIAGAPAVFPVPSRGDGGEEGAPALEDAAPSLSLQPPSAAAALAPPGAAAVLPPQPEYDSGAFLLSEWLGDAGYDLNVQHHTDARFSDSIRFQQPGYWIKQSQVHANRKIAGATATSTTGGASISGAGDVAEGGDFQPVLADEFVLLLLELADRVGEKDLLSLNPTQLNLEPSDWARISVHGGSGGGVAGHSHPHLPLPALRLRYSFLRLFNRLFATLLPLIDLRRTVDARSIAGLVSSSKPFLFPSVKHKFLSVILSATAEEAKTPQISVNRIALQMKRSRGEASDFLHDSLFAKTEKQIMRIDPFHLRPVRPAGTEPFLSFEVQFRGEQVVGEGGPFRQLFNDLGRELLDHSSMLQPTPNALNKIGDQRDKYCIQPSAHSPQHMQFFQYLGVLFGCCLRTGVRFPLDLSPTVWKGILSEELTPADLRSIDASAADSLAFILDQADEDALEAMQQSFTTKLSDGSVVELKAQGEEEKVNWNNRREYVGLVVAARLVESQPQVEAIRRGIAKIIPLQLLNLLTPLDLELLICGRNTIDVDLLRRHTVLSGVDANAPHIDLFWQVLTELDQHHRKLFIKFAWAQERLPVDDAEFIRTHTRFLIKPSSYPNPDQALPRSDTCFFNFELPAYSTAEIMRAKLLYAIQSDSSMNADEKSVRDAEGDGRNNRGRRFEEDDY